jgi:hypothetical protein
MEKIDARKHSPKTQFEICKQVIRLRKQEISNKLIAEGLDRQFSFLGILFSRPHHCWVL